MLRRAAIAAVVLAGVLAPVAYADGPGGGVCDNSGLLVTVCASDAANTPGSGGGSSTGVTPAGTSGGADPSAPKCTYEKADPQPPAENLEWEGKTPDDGAIYRVVCEGGRVGVVFISSDGGAPAPRIDPELVARRAVDSMKLLGPAVASPRVTGRYVVGMPMWMWVEQGRTTFGPATASATAGGVTVTATARVSSIRWEMGDGTTVTCDGAGTRYDASQGKNPSPDCGHRYKAPSIAQTDGKYAGKATATWTVEWNAPALGDAGEFTETRETSFAVDVREVQVLN